MKRYYKGVLVSFIFAFIISFGVSTYLMGQNKSNENETTGVNYEQEAADISFLILGVDERLEDVGRSDVMTLMKLTGTGLQILQIPRDTLVYIQGHGQTKINHAYAYGGAKLAKKVTEELTKTKITYSAVINLSKLKSLVDQIGGVDITIDQQMVYSDPWDDGEGGLQINFSPGPYHLNGEDVARFIRYRDQDGDIGRLKRQKQFLLALIQKAESPTSWPIIMSVVSNFDKYAQTDIPGRVILSACRQALFSEPSISILDGYPEMIAGVSYWVPTTEATTGKHNLVFNHEEPTVANTVVTKVNPSPSVVSAKPVEKEKPDIKEAEIEVISNQQEIVQTEAVQSAREKLRTINRHSLPPGDPSKISR